MYTSIHGAESSLIQETLITKKTTVLCAESSLKETLSFLDFIFCFLLGSSIRKDLDRVHSSMDTALAANLAMGSSRVACTR